MKIISSLLALIVMTILTGCATQFSQRDFSHLRTPETVPDDPFAAVLRDQMPALLANNRVPGAVVSRIKQGGVVWTMAFGVADYRTGKPMQPDMLFNHGSDAKIITAWSIMRLVEAGKIELDAPANRYLKRWKFSSTQFDPNDVTIRRLLSHTAGLAAHNSSFYREGARSMTLVEVLEGKNQNNGGVFIQRQPGSNKVYSNGGFEVLQMVIEDVSGEPFTQFVEREIARPLGLFSLHWKWTPELKKNAPTPYDSRRKNWAYLNLAAPAAGNGICTVPDFARFLAAVVPGPHNEPPGRGVLQSETIATMTEIQPNANDCGLAYGVSMVNGEKFLSHTGRTPGWTAGFVFNVDRRDGFVVANNSFDGESFIQAIGKLWGDIIGREMESTTR